MKAHLLYRDRDQDLQTEPPPEAQTLAEDLGLDEVWAAMAAGDPFLAAVVRRVTLASLLEGDDIRYRQQIEEDCLQLPEMLDDLYSLAVTAVEGERRIWGLVSRHPAGVLHRARQSLELFVPLLQRLRARAEAAAPNVHSEGLITLCSTLRVELDDQYLATLDSHLERLRLAEGQLFSAQLGPGNKGISYVLRSPVAGRSPWSERLGIGERSQYSFRIAPRDEAGLRALAELQDRGLNSAADAVGHAADHVLSFFVMLRFELGFYLGARNLHRRLTDRGQAVCWPVPAAATAAGFRCRGLYDVGLALRSEAAIVGNDVDASGRALVVVTGANSGGKSTFLRSLGLAQLMFQAGLFVAGREFVAAPRASVLTHFIRAEDSRSDSGRLDEELTRMDAIVERLTPRSEVLLNEPFSGTNEREGSELARQVIRAMVEAGVSVVLVTHFFDLADGLRRNPPGPTLCLRAERLENGSRTFRLLAGAPSPTAFGGDLLSRLEGELRAAGTTRFGAGGQRGGASG